MTYNERVATYLRDVMGETAWPDHTQINPGKIQEARLNALGEMLDEVLAKLNPEDERTKILGMRSPRWPAER